MSFRYAALQSPSTLAMDRELEASFDVEDSDSEDKDSDEGTRLTRRNSTTYPDSSVYNFESQDYDCPPPGSPPHTSSPSLRNNNIGNSNGMLPLSPQQMSLPRRLGWIRRTVAAVIPNYVQRNPQSSGRIVGGGIENDGVFTNINAKPGRGRVISDGESRINVAPEEVQSDAPPSYATAQADAVPPYWETTILAPASFSSVGEMMVEGMPTGSVFSFLWNFLVSMSFQFVGFLLTFLLHSTHAAKLGSRAGLGITLIHYGFYIRSRALYGDGAEPLPDSDVDSLWSWRATTTSNPVKPTFGTAAEAEGFYQNGMLNETSPSSYPPMALRPVLSEGVVEWLSFVLMTIGWFVLLTSTLSFWRVKRWERSIMTTTPDEPHPVTTLESFGFLLHNMNFGMSTRTNHSHDVEAAIESDGVGPRIPHQNIAEDAAQPVHVSDSHAAYLQLRQNLRSAGLL